MGGLSLPRDVFCDFSWKTQILGCWNHLKAWQGLEDPFLGWLTHMAVKRGLARCFLSIWASLHAAFSQGCFLSL